MSSAVTASMRAGGWNVLFTIGDNRYLAGIYQNPRKPAVTFGDVCAELALCFEYPGGNHWIGDFSDRANNDTAPYNDTTNTAILASSNSDRGDDDGPTLNPWTNIAFALTETPEEAAEQDPADYPAFVTPETFDKIVPGLSSPNSRQQRTVTYHIVRHRPCNLPAGSLNDHIKRKCVHNLADPSRLRHPSYLPCNKAPSDSRLSIMPLRRKLKARSQSPPKRSAGSNSPRKPDEVADDDYDNMLAPAGMDIDMDEARRVANNFRMACIHRATCCAVSGDGEPWCPGQPIGPGVHACHIVPQQHYHLYPMPHRDDAAQDSTRRLRLAWERTWSPDNGILLMKHLHELFDARLFSIHPTTLRIRVFVPYRALEPYHGQRAQVAHKVDRKALAHHYDMCCIENMAAERPNLESPALSPDAASRASTSATSLVSRSGGGSTPLSGQTDLPMTPTTGRDQAPTTQPTLLMGDPSKRQRSTRDDDGWQADDNDHLQRGGRSRQEDDHDFDGYITIHNSRAFLADVNWELLRYRGL